VVVKKHQMIEAYPDVFFIKAKEKSYTLKVEKVEEWVNEINTAIDAHHEKQRLFPLKTQGNRPISTEKQKELNERLGFTAPIMIPDNHVALCQLCNVEFTFVNRRHHCRACGNVVCGDCSSQKAPLRYKNWDSERVCDKCFDILWKELGKDASTAIRAKFVKKKERPGTTRAPKGFQRMKVAGDDPNAKMKGYLHKYSKGYGWTKLWIVLKDFVLYELRAAGDNLASKDTPILGYQIEPEYILNSTEVSALDLKDTESGRAFRLTHKGTESLLFYAENVETGEKWVEALHEAVTGGLSNL